MYQDSTQNTQVSSLLVMVAHHAIGEERNCEPSECKKQEICHPRFAPTLVASVEQVASHTYLSTKWPREFHRRHPGTAGQSFCSLGFLLLTRGSSANQDPACISFSDAWSLEKSCVEKPETLQRQEENSLFHTVCVVPFLLSLPILKKMDLDHNGMSTKQTKALMQTRK